MSSLSTALLSLLLGMEQDSVAIYLEGLSACIGAGFFLEDRKSLNRLLAKGGADIRSYMVVKSAMLLVGGTALFLLVRAVSA